MTLLSEVIDDLRKGEEQELSDKAKEIQMAAKEKIMSLDIGILDA